MSRALAALAVAMSVAGRVAAQQSTTSPRVPPPTLFTELVRVITLEDWAKAERGVHLMAEAGIDLASGPLAHPGKDLEAAIVAHDRGRAIEALGRLVATRAGDLIREATLEPNEAARRLTIRQAFAEFLTLTPVLKPTRFQLHQQIEASFRAVHASAGAGGAQFSVAAEKLLALLRQVAP